MYIDAELRIVPPELAVMNTAIKYRNEGVVSDIFTGNLIKDRIKYWASDSLLAEAAKGNVHGGLVSGLAWRNIEANNLNNEYVKDFVKSNENFYGCYIAPHGNFNEILEIIKTLDKNIFPVIEFIPKWSQFEFGPDEFNNLISEIGKLGFYIKLYTAHPTQKFKGNNVYETFCAIRSNPHAKFIIPHLGGLLPIYALNSGFEEIFDSTLFLGSVSSSLKMVPICLSVLPRNVAFATDFPFNHDCSIINSINTCNSILPNDPILRKSFFYDNINNFMDGLWNGFNINKGI